MNPKSVGKVSLLPRRNDDEESRHDSNSSTVRLSQFEVVIDPGYLSNPWDVSALWKGWEASTALKNSSYEECTEILPGFLFAFAFKIANIVSLMLSWTHLFLFGNKRKPDIQRAAPSAPAWFCRYAAEFANPYYHWFGTCAMGSVKTKQDDYDFVVDEFLCVRGVSALRVCDSSVFPDCVSVPTALTCAALGFASSEFITSCLNHDLPTK
jgi:choline dehydrogenase-like flavoprotein